MTMSVINNTNAKPFLKWAGGKTQLLNNIEARLPSQVRQGTIDKYVEPFVGGGAVFFYLVQRYHFNHFYLLDINEDLIRCFQAVRDNVETLIRYLSQLKNEFHPLSQTERKKFFLEIRADFNEEKKRRFSTKTAAKLIFLNKTCFNGLYRVNRKGEFNVPFGKYKNPNICDKENLRFVSEILQSADIICGDFEDSIHFIDDNTFVYLDPPYRPISKTASFTSYSKDAFNQQDQNRLADFCKKIDQKDGKFLLSNSDPKNEDPDDHFFEDYYSKFHIERVKASRAINCKGNKRGQIKELIITNY